MGRGEWKAAENLLFSFLFCLYCLPDCISSLLFNCLSYLLFNNNLSLRTMESERRISQLSNNQIKILIEQTAMHFLHLLHMSLWLWRNRAKVPERPRAGLMPPKCSPNRNDLADWTPVWLLGGWAETVGFPGVDTSTTVMHTRKPQTGSSASSPLQFWHAVNTQPKSLTPAWKVSWDCLLRWCRQLPVLICAGPPHRSCGRIMSVLQTRVRLYSNCANDLCFTSICRSVQTPWFSWYFTVSGPVPAVALRLHVARKNTHPFDLKPR